MASLVESTNALLEEFGSRQLYASGLRNDLLVRGEEAANDGGQALGKSMTENFTSYTNLSDGSAYSVDPSDLRRLGADLEAYTEWLRQVKMQWVESNVKRTFLERLLAISEDGQYMEPGSLFVTQRDCEQLEDQRVASKSILKAKKAEAETICLRMADVARQLDNDLNHHLAPAMDEARALSRSIQDMELELAMLRNSRPEEERMTVAECNATLDQQTAELVNLGERLQEGKSKRMSQNAACLTAQKEVERLSAERARMEKLQADAKGAVRNKDKRIEDNCRRLAERTAILSNILNVTAVQPQPNGELRIQYDLAGGRTATLAIYPDVSKRRITGAKLLESNINIEDIAQRCVQSNDVRELVAEVLARIE